MSNQPSTPESAKNRESFGVLDFSAFPHEVVIDAEIVLNDFAPEDAERLEHITSSEDVRKYIPWAGEDKAAYIERTTRNRDTRGPRYAIRYNGELVGHFTVFPSPDVLGVIEMGYVLGEEYRGHGIISRAFPVVEQLAMSIMPGMKLGLCINDANEPSQKVATRFGYQATETVSEGDRLYLKQDTDE